MGKFSALGHAARPSYGGPKFDFPDFPLISPYGILPHPEPQFIKIKIKIFHTQRPGPFVFVGCLRLRPKAKRAGRMKNSRGEARARL